MVLVVDEVVGHPVFHFVPRFEALAVRGPFPAVLGEAGPAGKALRRGEPKKPDVVCRFCSPNRHHRHHRSAGAGAQGGCGARGAACPGGTSCRFGTVSLVVVAYCDLFFVTRLRLNEKGAAATARGVEGPGGGTPGLEMTRACQSSLSSDSSCP